MISYSERSEQWKQKHRDTNRRWKQRHRETVRRWKREYYQKHREQILKKQEKKQKVNRKLVNAQRLAEKHISLGKTCENCESTEGLERHHPDYDKPLDVRTLCKKCHRNIHVPF